MHLADARWLAAASVLIILFVRFGWQTVRLRRTRGWPKTWATIQSAEMETVNQGQYLLPCFIFSYLADGEQFGGRFSLFADEQSGRILLKTMIHKRIEIQFHPKRPATWYIPNKRIEGHEVEQKLGPQLIERLYPSD